MAQRDFVKKKNKTKKNSSRVIPNLMMAIAIILVIVFVAILYIVSTNKPNRPTSQPVAQTQKPETTLPEKPQERWTYLKELENPDSTATTTEPQASSPSQNQQAVVQERQQILNSFVNEGATTTSQNSPPIKSETPSTVTTSPIVTTPQGKWNIQCGAFKDLSNANALKAKIALATGIESEIQSAKFHRVVIGPLASKAQAEKTINQLKTNGITTCIISGK